MDKKSQHVGNHGGRYVDKDGLTKQFTYIDHDPKPKIATGERMSPEELELLLKQVHQEKLDRIEKILLLPAVSFLRSGNTLAEGYIIRDPQKGIIWDEGVVRGLIVNDDMARTMYNMTWRNTVQERYASESMTLEDLKSGKWKEWI